MEGKAMERARELFLRYNGNRFFMDLNGASYEYDGHHVPKKTEEAWAREYVLGFFESKARGKEALRAYSAVAEFVGRDGLADFWESCLFYPLRAEHLDDVTTLFILSRMWHPKGWHGTYKDTYVAVILARDKVRIRMCLSKDRYESESAASLAVYDREAKTGLVLRSYQCPCCGGYHLTKMPLEEYLRAA